MSALFPSRKSGPKAVLCVVSATLFLTPRAISQAKAPACPQPDPVRYGFLKEASLSAKILDFAEFLGSACTKILDFTAVLGSASTILDFAAFLGSACTILHFAAFLGAACTIRNTIHKNPRFCGTFRNTMHKHPGICSIFRFNMHQAQCLYFVCSTWTAWKLQLLSVQTHKTSSTTADDPCLPFRSWQCQHI